MDCTITGLKELKIVQYNNSKITGDCSLYNLLQYDNGELKDLREVYALEKVIEAGKTDWEKLILLRKWVNSRWAYGWSGYKKLKNGNALEILELANNGAGFACGTYAELLQKCCIALGFPARGVSILSDKSDIPEGENAVFTGHRISEVWSNDFSKWVAFDATTDSHYEKDGIPLSAYEVNQVWLNGEEDGVELSISGDLIDIEAINVEEHLREFFDAALKLKGKEYAGRYFTDSGTILKIWRNFNKHKSMHYYTYVIVDANNKSFIFGDRKKPPILLVNEYPIQRAWSKLEWARNCEAAYFTLNQTFISLKVLDDKHVDNNVRISVKLKHTNPYFSRYYLKLNDEESQIKDDEFIWTLKKGKNSIEANTINYYERKGIKSSIVINLDFCLCK